MWELQLCKSIRKCHDSVCSKFDAFAIHYEFPINFFAICCLLIFSCYHAIYFFFQSTSRQFESIYEPIKNGTIAPVQPQEMYHQIPNRFSSNCSGGIVLLFYAGKKTIRFYISLAMFIYLFILFNYYFNRCIVSVRANCSTYKT